MFKGRVSAILPEVNPATRTLKARIEVANPGRTADARHVRERRLHAVGAQSAVLVVPSEAVIQTGKRGVVIVQPATASSSRSTSRPAPKPTARRKSARVCSAGQKVVVSGQFLIDSEASLRGTTSRMTDVPAAMDAPAGKPHGAPK